MKQFEGSVERLIFENEESGFRIYAIKSNDVSLMRNKYQNVTVKGTIPKLKKDEVYTFILNEGVTNDSKYGPSYNNVTVLLKMPESLIETEKFLSNLIGEKRAQSLLEVYPDVIELILQDRQIEIDLQKVKGVKEKTFGKIEQKVLENFKYFNIISRYGDVFSLNVIMKLFDEFHSETQVLEQLKLNPYRTLCSLQRIGFKRADALILKTIDTDTKNKNEPRFDKDLKSSKERLVFYIHYCLENLIGHTYQYLSIIEKDCEKELSEAFHHFEVAIQDELFFVEENKIALREVYELEKWIGETITFASSTHSSLDLDVYFLNYQQQDEIILDEKQLSLLPLVLNHQMTCLFGVAGSGKTTILKALLRLMLDYGKKVLLASPTGRAANILSDKTSYKAQTIHMLLKWTEFGFLYNEDNQLEADLVVIDEASMLDLPLFHSLLKAINFRRTKLLLVGDPQQLPSVGVGNVFEDLRLSLVPKLEINKCYRTSGGILNVATLVRQQQFHIPKHNRFSMVTDESAYYFIHVADNSLINQEVLQLIENSINQLAYSLDDILVISPVNESENGGAFELNLLIQERFNKESKGFKQSIYVKNHKKEIDFKLNDKIMNTKNDYRAMFLLDSEYSFLKSLKQESYEDYEDLRHEVGFVANGELGVIRLIFDEFVVIDFNGQIVLKPKEELTHFQLGYVITTHKSQGSEAPCVIPISTKNFGYMLNCNHMYVAITRAQKHCFHVGYGPTVNARVKVRENKMRRTFLSEFIG